MGSSVPETGASRVRAVSTPADLINDTEPAEDTGPPTRDVRLFWCANAADSLGSQASGVVLPLLLLGLGYSPAVVGLVAGVSTATGLMLGPLVAVPADRGARKRVMFWSAVVSALAMGSVAVVLAVAEGRPSLVHLLAAVLVERTATACYEAAARGTVALISTPGNLPRVVAGLEAGDRGALVAGPALGGMLYQVSRALPFVLDAVSYAVTAACVRAMRSHLRADRTDSADAVDMTNRADASDRSDGASESAGSAAQDACVPRPVPRPVPRSAPGTWSALAAEASAGVRLVRTTPLLRLVLVWTTTVNGVLAALYYDAVFTLQESGHGGTSMGLVLALSGAAGLAGSLAAPRLVRGLSPVRAVVTVSWLMVPLAAALATAGGPWAYGALFGGLCLIMPPATVILQARAIQGTPPELQARAGSVLATAAGGAAATAPALAGFLTAHAGAAGPALVSAGVLVLLALHTTLRAGRTLATGAPPKGTPAEDVRARGRDA
ncbi:MFS transporter [Streptomyces sp. SLBN-115]|uniref:MFS transporter n=1 Tax=Streptomyces sp. SLBN-115 TaxID=2768453 RepID=UPI0011525915|nr:MFS transporter [Streptomyces sp. SLBN-115]TQJ57551.1 putative MFS family arabinose efflux permease [Streptomyces sp. SLBN-115]